MFFFQLFQHFYSTVDDDIVDARNNNKLILFLSLNEEMPENWETMPTNTSCQAIPIKAGTAEYTDVQNVFRATCGLNIVKVDYT